MAKHGKNYSAAVRKLDKPAFGLDEAMVRLKEVAYAKFDETVEIALLLGVDPRHADQMVRGTVVLPHGTGKSLKVLAIVGPDKVADAQAAGADIVWTGPEAVTQITGGNLDFQAVVATPDVMRDLGKLGKVLGPRGLMPNPKTGTVTPNIGQAVKEIKGGKVEFRVNKTSIVHGIIGKKSFAAENLLENFKAFVGAVQRAKPSSAKGRYIKSCFVSATMSPSIPIDLAEVDKLQQAERA
ncbi:MAG: 50S ribosomal protein L1 [Candidatus Polarisedimenticolia bacterium]|nr:50S ribosomal protein L1 [bacterium]